VFKLAWSKNGTPNTLGSAGDDIDITDLTAKKFNVFLAHTFRTSGSTNDITNEFTLDNNSNTDYSRRRSADGSADSTLTSYTSLIGSQSNEIFEVVYSVNIDSEEKLFYINGVTFITAGAGTAPSRTETATKCDTTTNTGQFTRVDLRNSNANSDYDIGSNLTILGTD